jgi:hypothetical protein
MKQNSHRPGLGAVARAAAAALQWRLLILWTGCLLLPTAVLSLPVWGLLSGALDYSVHASVLARQLDALAAFDLRDVFAQNVGTVGTAGVLALLITLLLSPLLSGMAITAARVTRAGDSARAGFRQLTRGALAQYGRMLRMLVWSVVPLGAALALGGVVMNQVARHNESAITEADAALVSWLGIGVALLLFVLAHATLDAGRAVLALAPERTSAVKAWWSGVVLLARRPLAVLGVWLAVALPGCLVAAVLGLVRANFPPLGVVSVVLGFLVIQLAALALAWTRNARLFALIALADA